MKYKQLKLVHQDEHTFIESSRLKVQLFVISLLGIIGFVHGHILLIFHYVHVIGVKLKTTTTLLRNINFLT